MHLKFLSPYFKIALLVLTLFLSFGCNQNKIIEEERFIKIYTDIIIAEDTTSASSNSKDNIIQVVLSKYNETIEDYKATIQYYNQDSERWEKFFKKAIAYLEAKKTKIGT